MAPTIDDYHRQSVDKIREDVRSTPDSEVIGRDTDEWVDYYIRKAGLERIEADFGAIRLEETTARDHAALLVVVPVSSADDGATVDIVARHGLAGGNQWLGFDYSSFHNHQYARHLGQVVPQTQVDIQRARNRIEEYIQSLNSSIEQANKWFPGQVRQIIVSKQEAVRAKHRDLDALAAAVRIPLVKRADAASVIPTAVRVRKTIAPLLPPKTKPQERPVLDRDKFEAIVEIVDNQCRQFELTPTVFQGMPEEALRDVMLSSLNIVFEGGAGGEVFRVLGKTDIHLRISRGEVFIAELKVWAGPASLAEVVGQLLERLTWRDAYGVVIIFSKNVDFGAVLAGIAATLPALPGAVAPSFRKEGANVFVTRFVLPTDASTQVEVHVRAYSLYTARSSGRTS
jgi:hypothetical protein